MLSADRTLFPLAFIVSTAACQPATLPPTKVTASMPASVVNGMPTIPTGPISPAPVASGFIRVWPLPTDVRARITAAGLDAMEQEAFTVHVHAHLNVFKDGQAVEVPAFIGIDPQGGFISPLHTHAAQGSVHIESPSTASITLGQFFIEWNAPLDGAKAYLNGQPVSEPAALVLADAQEITVAFGTPPVTIPSTYPGYTL